MKKLAFLVGLLFVLTLSACELIHQPVGPEPIEPQIELISPVNETVIGPRVSFNWQTIGVSQVEIRIGAMVINNQPIFLELSPWSRFNKGINQYELELVPGQWAWQMFGWNESEEIVVVTHIATFNVK